MHEKTTRIQKAGLQYPSSPPGNSSSSVGCEQTHKVLRKSFRGCWLLMTMLWKCKLKQISGQTHVKAYKILEIMACNRRKTSMLSLHSAMNRDEPESNQGQTGAE